MTPFLQATDLRKRYGHATALNGVNLAIERGELFGLVGPNGAGKTTLLSILGGLIHADSGEVVIDGQPFHRSDRNARRRIGLGTQDLAVYPELTSRENLLFFGRLYELDTLTLKGRIDDLLTAVGLSDRADDRVGGYSGGMKRRLNLAVAVVHEPDLLFLDEPTTGVDPQSRHLIFELVRKLRADGTTIIYTSHYMEEVQALCPRIAIIDAGVVKACDTREKLLKLLPATLTLEGVPAAEPFRSVPGVTTASVESDLVVLTADAIAPLLPRVAEVCRANQFTPTGMTVSEPTLERVFLHLTGHGMRDS